MLKMQVIGFLGRDAEVNTVNDNTVINFNVAHTEKWKDNQGQVKEKTAWVQCAYWTDKTGIAPYLKKGTQIYAEGTPEAKTYPKNDGTTGVNLIMRVGMVQLLGSPSGNNESTPAAAPTYQAPRPAARVGQVAEPIEDLPF